MIGGRVMVYAVAAALAAAVAGVAVQSVRLGAALRDAAGLRATMAQEGRQAAERALAQAQAFRFEERRRSSAAQEVERVAQNQAARVRAHVVGARAAGDGLRVAAAAFASGGGAASHPGTAASSSPAGDRSQVLADMLGRAVAEAVELARIADERGTAGAACERAYRSLTDDQPAGASGAPTAGDSAGDFGGA